MRESTKSNVWKGAVAGMLGGLVASSVMNVFQLGLTTVQKATSADGERTGSSQQGDDATVKAASTVSESLAGHTLTKSEKKIAGPVVHYAFGSAMGGMYGAASELAPSTANGFGLAFGSALWFGADEIAVPAAGLSKPPTEIAISTHASALVMHLVYGTTLEGVRRLVRAAI